MPNVTLLLGAGFSKNWHGFLATEVTADLMSRLQDDTYLLELLDKNNFEDALFQLQTDFLLLGHSKNALQEERLDKFQNALSGVFDRMNNHFQSVKFEFSDDVARSLRKFLTGFDAIFTLNQDLLLELQYHRREDVATWQGTPWQGGEMPGLRPLPVTDHHNPATNKWRPEVPFLSNPRMQPYYKLHGSSGWVTDDGRSLLVVGRDKTGAIAHHPILHWTYERFEDYLRRDDTRLMVIGYGFGDEHINQSLLDAHQAGKLKVIYLIQPSGKGIIESKCPALAKVPCIECTVPISDAFNGNGLALDRMRGIFRTS
jgi:SIR2-like domain